MAEKRVIEYEAASELANDDWLLIDGVTEGTRKARPSTVTAELGEQVTNIATAVSGLTQVAMGHEQSFAPDYDESTSYDVGDLVMQYHGLYKCTAPTTGAWDAGKWARTEVSEQLEESGKIDDVQVNGVSVVTNKVAEIDLTDMQADIDSKQADTKIGGTSILDENKVLNMDNFVPKASIPSGAISTFGNAMALPMPSLTVGIEAVQSGTGDPSPTNVRPFTGWSAVNMYRIGKNLAELSTRASATVQGITSEVKADNTIVASGTSTGNGDIVCTVANPFILKKGQTYTISLQGTDIRERQFTIFIGTAYINVGVISAAEHSLTFTVINKKLVCNQVMLRSSIGATVNINAKLQIELGTTASEYVAPNGTTYTTTLKDGQGNPLTCYGGQLQNENGVQRLTLTHGYIASYNGETLPSTWISDRDVYAEGTTPTTGAEVVYTLATPQQIPQDSLSIATQEGTNNLWADSGDIQSGEYFRNVGMTLNDIISRVEALENA